MSSGDHFFLDTIFFHLEQGVFFENGFRGNPEFESNYIDLRQNEGRLYDDNTVSNLPQVVAEHPLKKEWIIRKRSSERLIRYLKSRPDCNVVELGCGNGWLANFMSQSLSFHFFGLDINTTELKQGARLFGNNPKISFLCADIFSSHLRDSSADVFVLAGAVQYFPDLQKLLIQLLQLLKPGGEIHIIDSPFYTNKEAIQARKRSDIYFQKRNHPEMGANYFHHTWESFGSIEYKILYNPSKIIRVIIRVVRKDSPFPWIIIRK
jgi:SAM-dependent methyltransferase